MIECDFMIIGSGPAGSVLASELTYKGFKVSLIDRANNLKKTDKNSFIYSPYVEECPNHYTPVFSNQLGGNSALWNNKVYLISEDEFIAGEWLFSYEELLKHSLELAKKLEIDHTQIHDIIEVDGLKYSKSKRIKKLGNIFNYLKIKENKNIKIYSNSSPIKLKMKNKRIVSATILSLKEKKKIEIKIKRSIIFCAGGLGNPNIIQNLINDKNNLIGKNLCDHSHINLVEIKKEANKNLNFFGKYFINSSNDSIERNLFTQKEKYFVGVNFDYLPDPARTLKRVFIKSRTILSKYILSLVIKYYSFLYKIINKFLSVLKIKGRYSFEFFFSQNKNKNNSIELNANKFDKFGLNKSNIKWKVAEDERIIYNDLIGYFAGKNGRLFNSQKDYSFDINKIFAGLHPSCTTTISQSVMDGCVDPNLKLHGYDNIYVGGSSVFQNNGFTNPTWTIMTLSNRLAHHLSKK